MKVTIEKQSDGTYIAYNTSGDGTLIGTGESVNEAKTDFYNSLEELKGVYESTEMAAPEFLAEDIEFRFDISSLFEYFSMLNASALARYIGINESLMRQYRKGNTPISDAQLEKIESGIKQLGKELSSLKLV